MSVFAYRSTTIDGTVMDGVIEAVDEKTALDRITNTGLIPLEINALQGDGLLSTIRLRTTRGDLTAFMAELSTLLAAGLPLDRSLHILVEITEHQGMKEMVQALLTSIREGSSFSDALQKH